MKYDSKELQFQAIRQEVHKALMNYENSVSPGQRRDQGRSERHAGVIHYIPPRGNLLQYDKRGKMRVYRPSRAWVPTLDNTVKNLYQVVRHADSDVNPSDDELEVMSFKIIRDMYYDAMGEVSGDSRPGDSNADFGLLDDL